MRKKINLGAVLLFMTLFNAYASWTKVNVVGSNSELASIVIHDGLPYIAYIDNSKYDLYFAKWNGTGFDSELVDDNNVQGNVCLTFDNSGKASIAYTYDVGQAKIKLATKNTTTWDKQEIKFTENVVTVFSLDLQYDKDNNPNICFCGGYKLNYMKWNGTAWTHELPDANYGNNCKMGITDDGTIHISYFYQSENSQVKKVIYAHKAPGGNWINDTVAAVKANVNTGLAKKGDAKYIVYAEPGVGLFYKEPDGKELKVSNNSANFKMFNNTSDGQGNSYALVYQSYQAQVYSVNGTEWSSADAIDIVESTAGAMITVSDDGKPFVVVSQGGKTDMFYKEMPTTNPTNPTNPTNVITTSIKSKIYPNPFLSSVTFELELKQASEIDLRIYNAVGIEVACVKQDCMAGANKILWTGNEYKGVLFYSLKSSDGIIKGKLLAK